MRGCQLFGGQPTLGGGTTPFRRRDIQVTIRAMPTAGITHGEAPSLTPPSRRVTNSSTPSAEDHSFDNAAIVTSICDNVKSKPDHASPENVDADLARLVALVRRLSV
jgi:hypothetical protein